MAVARATADDVQHIYNIASVFNTEHIDTPLNPDKAYTALSQLVEDGLVFYTDKGAIVGNLYEDPFRDQLILLEIGWYAEEKSSDGLRLLNAFIQEAKRLKVDKIIMSTLTTSGDRVRKLLELKGFVLTEYSYSLTL